METALFVHVGNSSKAHLNSKFQSVHHSNTTEHGNLDRKECRVVIKATYHFKNAIYGHRSGSSQRGTATLLEKGSEKTLSAILDSAGKKKHASQIRSSLVTVESRYNELRGTAKFNSLF